MLFVGVVLARSGRFVVMSVDVCVPVCSYSVLNFSGRRTCTHKQCVRLSKLLVDSYGVSIMRLVLRTSVKFSVSGSDGEFSEARSR